MSEVQQIHDGGNPSEVPEKLVLTGKPASAEAVFYHEWARESFKAIPANLLDTLNKLITLDAALIGGGLLGLREDLMHRVFRVLVIAMLIVSLACAFRGTMPTQSAVNFISFESIRNHKERLIQRRHKWLWRASVSLIAAFVIALLGLVVKLF